MAEPTYWRVLAKGARKAHLAKQSSEGLGPEKVALCGKNLEDARLGSCGWMIPAPLGDECQECRVKSGHFVRPKTKDRQPLNLWQLRLKGFVEFCKTVDGWKTISDDQKRSVKESVLKAMKSNTH